MATRKTITSKAEVGKNPIAKKREPLKSKPAKTGARKKASDAALLERVVELERELAECRAMLGNTQTDFGRCMETLMNERGAKSQALGYILYGLAKMGLPPQMVALKCQAIGRLEAKQAKTEGR